MPASRSTWRVSTRRRRSEGLDVSAVDETPHGTEVVGPGLGLNRSCAKLRWKSSRRRNPTSGLKFADVELLGLQTVSVGVVVRLPEWLVSSPVSRRSPGSRVVGVPAGWEGEYIPSTPNVSAAARGLAGASCRGAHAAAP